MTDEMLDLFTADGKPAGVTIHRGDAIPAGLYPACADVWLLNSQGQLLLQLRDASKPNHPNQWCEAAGGAVQSGETPDEAARRETLEEIGFALDFSRGSKVFEYVGNHSLHHVYLFCQDADLTTLTLQPGEVSAVRYASPSELPAMVQSGEMVPTGYLSQLLQMLPILSAAYEKSDDHAENLS